MQTPTAPPVPAPVRAQLPPDSLTLRERWDWVRLQAWSWLLSSAHFLSSVSPAGWRLVTRTYHPVLDRIAAEHARIACAFAALDVPAYRHFVRQSATRPPKRLADFPETSKRGYVAAYDEADRCQEGELRLRGTVVDESSGSTGQPFNWARGARELRGIYRNTACYTRAVFRSDKLFVLNAYSMGAWATGTTTGAAMARIAMVKNTGPDLDKIVDTLEHFGPRFDYLVTAYPPFAKHLRDRLDAIGFPWERYRISVLTGGEGMTEALRDYLEARFAKVRSGYGASDLTIGIGAETTFTVELRRRLRSDQDLRDVLLGPGEQRLPMIFHYNPLETYLEVNERGELLCTVNSKHCLQPKLRYNIGDEALLHPLADVRRALRLDPARWREIQARAGEERMGLPLLFLFGRKDSTISYMGANIYPQDVEYGLYDGNPMAAAINRFCLELEELADLESRPVVNVELRDGAGLDETGRAELAETCRAGVLAHLARVSRDFAQSLEEDPASADLRVRVHEPGQGPFAGLGKLKNTYLTGTRR